MTTRPQTIRSENLRGAAMMVLSMALFAVEDAAIKHLSTRLPVGEVLVLFGVCSATILALYALVRGQGLPGRAVLHPVVLARTGAEAVGTFGYVLSLSLAPLALCSVILQATPLAVTMGAALILRERTGWRRWLAVAVGFCGVVITIAPWQASFVPAALFALLGVIGLGGRDLATRRLPKDVSSLHVSVLAFLVLLPTGLVLLLATGAAWVTPTLPDLAELAFILAFGISGYMTIVAATRMGELGFIAPFRYARIPFALVLAMLFFGETLGLNMILGGALVIGAGLYAFLREARLARGASAPT